MHSHDLLPSSEPFAGDAWTVCEPVAGRVPITGQNLIPSRKESLGRSGGGGGGESM